MGFSRYRLSNGQPIFNFEILQNFALFSFPSYILSQTYNATLFLFDYFYVNAHALSKLFHSVNSSFNQASNLVLVLNICLKLTKKQ